MSILDALRAGVRVADKVTKPIQATVAFRHFISADGEGTPTYLPPASRPPLPLLALVDWTQRSLRTPTGELSVSRASVTFLDVNALSDATNGEGVDDGDIIILPDGTTGPILDMRGFIDAGTGHPLATEVLLG